MDASGKISIGHTATTGTNTQLEVAGGSATELKVSAQSASNANFRGIRFGITGDANDYSGIRFQQNSGELRTEAGFAGWGGFQTFYTNGSERLRITSAGLVGVGTSAPVNSLQVTASALASVPSAGSSGHFLAVGSSAYGIAGGALTNGNGYLQVTRWDGTATNYDLLLQPNGGRVGIGTASPTYLCNVIAAAGSQNIFQAGQTGVSNGYTITSNGTNLTHAWFNGGSEAARIDSSGRLLVGTSSTSATSSVIIQNNSANSGPGILRLTTNSATPANGGSLGLITFGASNHSTATSINSSRDGGTWTPGTSQPSSLEFSTTPNGASSPTEKMRICSGSSNDDVIYFNCTGRTNVAPNTQGGRIYQSNGNCKVRTADSGAAFQFYSATGGTSSAVGQILVNASSTSYSTSSDYRLKENVVPLTGAAGRVNQLGVYRFNFISDPDKTVDGFIAHEVATIVPEAIAGEKDAVDDDGNPIYQGIDQSKLVPLLTAALQEAIVRIETLETRLTALEGGAA